jgi:hypothetical protein
LKTVTGGFGAVWGNELFEIKDGREPAFWHRAARSPYVRRGSNIARLSGADGELYPARRATRIDPIVALRHE